MKMLPGLMPSSSAFLRAGHAHARLVQRFERFENAGIGARVVEFVVAVVGHEKLERLVDVGLARLGAHRTTDQNGRSVADVRPDGFEVQGRQAEMLARRVDRVRQVELRIDQRAVQVEDEQIHCRELCHSPLSDIRRGGRAALSTSSTSPSPRRPPAAIADRRRSRRRSTDGAASTCRPRTRPPRH